MIHTTKGSLNVALLSKDDELEEIDKNYTKTIQDLRNVIAAKEIELTESLILNTEYEHEIKKDERNI